MAVLWLIKLCVKLVSWKTTSGERTRPQQTEIKVKTAASEEDIWPLLEEFSDDEDEGEEKERQDQGQGVDTRNGKRNSTSNVEDDVCVSTPIRVSPEQISSKLPIPLAQLNELIDRRMQVIKTDMLFTRKAQLNRFVERKRLIKKNS